MRVCLFTPTFLPRMGGQEIVVDQLARHFTALGHEVCVLAQHGSRRGTKAEVSVPYRLARFTKPLSQVWGIPGLRRALQRLHAKFPFDIVHSHSCYPTGYAALRVCRKMRVPLVVTSHGGDLAEDSRYRSRPLIMRRCRETLEKADAVTSISSYMRQQFLEVAPACTAQLHQVPNGVDCAALTNSVQAPPRLASEYGLARDSFLLFLGRLHRRKGVSVLIEAFAKVAQRHPKIPLVIAGDGEERHALRELAQGKGIDRIFFVGSVQGEARLWLLQNALALVLPTPKRETFGLVLLEAMANAKPVIGSRLGGIIDLIDEGETGRLVTPGDADSLAVAINSLLADESARAQMGCRAAIKAARYDWPVVAAQYLTLFENLLGAPREKAPA